MQQLPPAGHGAEPPTLPRLRTILQLYGLMGVVALVVLGLTFPRATLLVVAGALTGIGVAIAMFVGVASRRGASRLCLPHTDVCLDVSLAGPQRASERL